MSGVEVGVCSWVAGSVMTEERVTLKNSFRTHIVEPILKLIQGQV